MNPEGLTLEKLPEPGGSIGVLGSAGTAGGWVFGAGKCRGIAIWVPALVLQLTTSWSGLRH